MTVAEVICKIGRARNKINDELKEAMPDEDLIDILEDYIDMLENLVVKK